jgi:hypothetical protein
MKQPNTKKITSSKAPSKALKPTLSEALKPQDAPTPPASRNLGAKEEQVNREQVSTQPGSDAPGG